MGMRKLAKRTKHLNRSFSGNMTVTIVLILAGAFMFLPMLYVITNSLKPLDELWYFPPRFFAQNPTLRNFSELFRIMSNTNVPFLRYICNTISIAVLGTGGHLIFASMCAYVFAKHKFYGRDLMFNTVVIALMFNATVTAIPQFLVITTLGMINSFWAYVIPAFGSPLGLYLMKQFMESNVNDTIIEAAKIDGAGEWSMFTKIVMPMVRPGWLTLIVFSFQNLWNVGSTTYIFKEELKTINYALSQVLARGIARAVVGAAVSVVMMIVPITVFILTQSNIVQTMSTSGMKD